MDNEDPGARIARMLQYSVPVVRLGGISIRLHWSFFLMIFLFAAWTATGGESLVAQLGWGLLHATILYSLVLLHELCHAGAAALKGRRTDRIMLTPLGGMAIIDGAMVTPGMEAEVALAGPAVNLLLLGVSVGLFGIFGGFHLGLGPGASAALAFAFWANLSLALFNLLPAYPLDGGRVLRAYLSWRRGERRGTRVAARVGQVLGVCMVIAGIVLSSPAGWVLACIGVSNIIACEMSIRALEMGAGVYEEPVWGVRTREGYRSEDESGAEDAEGDLDKRVDAVLEKVSREGMQSLTRQERKLLKKASRLYRQKP